MTVTDSPYVGIDPATGRPADPGPHALLVAPTGAGKSFGVLGPAIAMRPAHWPAIVVSSKDDLVHLTCADALTRGPVRVLDLSGFAVLPDGGADWVRYDPTTALRGVDDAADLATDLLRAGGVAAGAATGPSGDSAEWISRAIAPLAAILWAASDASAKARRDAKSAGGIAAAVLTVGDVARWKLAIDRLRADPTAGTESAEAALTATAALDAKLLGSVIATMVPAVLPWTRLAVRPDEAIHTLGPRDLLTGTTYVISPGGPATGAAVALLTQSVLMWRRATSAARAKGVAEPPPLLLVVDEVANTAPLPDLGRWVTEARGLGIRVLAAVQTTAQLRERWGTAGGEVLERAFPSILALEGCADQDVLETAARNAGMVDRESVTTDADGRVISRTKSHGPALDASDLVVPQTTGPGPRRGRLIRGQFDAGLLDLPGYDVIMKWKAGQSK
ncbi:type IV secretory system conjugative DNA transfer family protein [Gordonia otitidis]|uniref:TraD/TraG TraM recognition site domain-containing protein n=1 Tax=Gordonia otitidis (strain DSM 44809 / CCUG 52243 / JCM 12355 / NBRC 100426 / IFM 10032) TaxID=1108044 RepID=H5THH8_GORO1|nr:type IV secretory system conjugative DNA transfer family protein [Gordonia otitidis]GAB32936.1 hypothetical protein GOOTI_034_00030 [Gordonia otitidis NBRC 100426]